LHLFNTTFSEFSKHIVDRVSTAATRGKETTMHDDLDLAERESVAVSFEAVSSLVSFYLEHPDKIRFSPPLVLGWDVRRQLGDGEGFEIFRELMFEYEPRLREEELLGLGDPRTVITHEQYQAALAEQWQRYGQREMHWTDMMLVDAMASARADGWKIADDMFFIDDLDAEIPNPTPVRAATEAILDDLAQRSGAKRAAIEADWRAACLREDEAERKLAPVTTSAITPAVAIEDFVAYLPMHQYIYIPTRALWPASSVNSAVPAVAVDMQPKPIAAASWLDKHRAVQCLTWAPGKPMEIRDQLVDFGGWVDHPGATTFNEYRSPTIEHKAGDPSLWVNHVRHLFGEDADHIIHWCAQRVQHPDQKINHALVLGGDQGIGKDTLLEPVKAAVGSWNFVEVGPEQMLGQFNGYRKCVILRVSEARDLGDSNRYAFYEHLKTLTAAPPDMLRVNEKHLKEHHVPNICGVTITTNHKDSLQLPPDDRRHFVAWSPLKKEDFTAEYWNGLYDWFASGGNEIVAGYLAGLDLSGFNAKAPPPKTRAWREIVDMSRAPEDAEMADAIDALGKPDVVTIGAILARAGHSLAEFLRDNKRNSRNIPKRFKACSYVMVRNPDADSGLWRVGGKRQAVYAKDSLSERDQIAAARRLTIPPLPC
jgi:hypothetical protein